MKYGESAFCILYLIFAIAGGCVILRRAKDRTGKMMGLAALILGREPETAHLSYERKGYEITLRKLTERAPG